MFASRINVLYGLGVQGLGPNIASAFRCQGDHGLTLCLASTSCCSVIYDVDVCVYAKIWRQRLNASITYGMMFASRFNGCIWYRRPEFRHKYGDSVQAQIWRWCLRSCPNLAVNVFRVEVFDSHYYQMYILSSLL